MTIFFEVPVLAIVNEVYFRHKVREEKDLGPLMEMGRVRLQEKYRLLEKHPAGEFSLADFGTRRRFSRAWQEEVVQTLSGLPTFAGTSNVDLARRLGLTPIGTMAHEFMMVGQAQDDVPLVKFQSKMLQSWVDEYRGDLGIALTDTVGIDAFLRDFDLYYAKLYDGLRHDSGDPLWWAQKVIAHYKSLGIDPLSKVLVFSDGLSPQKAIEIAQTLQGQAKLSFGIGTNFTNDFPGLGPLQIVMKLTQVNGRPVAKVSDSPGKGMCKDESFLAYLRKVYGIES
jgi:nicotinate phosphoribosyltransferase